MKRIAVWLVLPVLIVAIVAAYLLRPIGGWTDPLPEEVYVDTSSYPEASFWERRFGDADTVFIYTLGFTGPEETRERFSRSEEEEVKWLKRHGYEYASFERDSAGVSRMQSYTDRPEGNFRVGFIGFSKE